MQSLPPGDCATMDSLLAYLSHQNIGISGITITEGGSMLET
jgi:hypothetical protein